MKKILIFSLLPLFLAACSADQPPQNSPTGFGPPSVWQGKADTGMDGFKASGSWGPGNESMHPATPGAFKGY